MTTPREPSGEALLSARLARAYPSLSAYSAASLAAELCAIERAQRRHAERCCSGEDGGYVRTAWRANCDGHQATTTVHDPDAEERAGKRIERSIERWRSRLVTLTAPSQGGADLGCAARQAKVNDSYAIELQGDPRGRVLLVRLPGESEASGV